MQTYEIYYYGCNKKFRRVLKAPLLTYSQLVLICKRAKALSVLNKNVPSSPQFLISFLFWALDLAFPDSSLFVLYCEHIIFIQPYENKSRFQKMVSSLMFPFLSSSDLQIFRCVSVSLLFRSYKV